jgi:putative NADH-flavin reductase
MKIALLGGTGRTGRLVLQQLRSRGHDVVCLVRDPGKAAGEAVVVGDSRDREALMLLVSGADAVVSALGPAAKGDHTLHRDTASALVRVMAETGVRRFVGISGAGIDVPGDRKSGRDRLISKLIPTFGGKVVADKPAEYQVFAASDLDWTLVRPPRLTDGPATGNVEHDAHRSAATTMISRADLAGFIAEVVEQELYIRQAPLVAAGKARRPGAPA